LARRVSPNTGSEVTIPFAERAYLLPTSGYIPERWGGKAVPLQIRRSGARRVLKRGE
jgi:hypothetical protein